MSTEATFRDTSEKSELLEQIDNLCDELSDDLTREGTGFFECWVDCYWLDD